MSYKPVQASIPKDLSSIYRLDLHQISSDDAMHPVRRNLRHNVASSMLRLVQHLKVRYFAFLLSHIYMCKNYVVFVKLKK